MKKIKIKNKDNKLTERGSRWENIENKMNFIHSFTPARFIPRLFCILLNALY